METAMKSTALKLEHIVPEYHSTNPLARKLFRRRLTIALRHIEEISPGSILDVGCGSGLLIRLINQQGLFIPEMHAIDVLPPVLELNLTIPNCSFTVQDILRTDFPEHSFGLITCLDTLEHIEDLDRAIRELGRILKPGGHLITSEPTESVLYKTLRFLLKGTYSQESGPCAGIHYHNARQIDRGIRENGFQLIKGTQIPCPPPLDLFHVNLYRLPRNISIPAGEAQPPERLRQVYQT
jgi:2-polyprenyl-3-methyl-5-hydroxy-6-metoxy-1,4-benzoquinol methylase